MTEEEKNLLAVAVDLCIFIPTIDARTKEAQKKTYEDMLPLVTKLVETIAANAVIREQQRIVEAWTVAQMKQQFRNN